MSPALSFPDPVPNHPNGTETASGVLGANGINKRLRSEHNICAAPITIIVSPYLESIKLEGPDNSPVILANAVKHALVSTGLGGMVDQVLVMIDERISGAQARYAELLRATANLVRVALNNRSFPIVIAADCVAEIGTMSGIRQFELDDKELNCVWFDAHFDLNTPATASNDFNDSMAMSMMAGDCLLPTVSGTPGYRPFNLNRLIYVGPGLLQESERDRVERLIVASVIGEPGRRHNNYVGRLGHQLHRLQNAPSPVAIHLDLDCLDLDANGRVNFDSVDGGLTQTDLYRCLCLLAQDAKPITLTISAFSPWESEGNSDIARVSSAAIVTFLLAMMRQGHLDGWESMVADVLEDCRSIARYFDVPHMQNMSLMRGLEQSATRRNRMLNSERRQNRWSRTNRRVASDGDIETNGNSRLQRSNGDPSNGLNELHPSNGMNGGHQTNGANGHRPPNGMNGGRYSNGMNGHHERTTIYPGVD